MKDTKDLMQKLNMNEALNHLAIASSVCLFGLLLRNEDGHIMTRSLELEVEGLQ